MTVLVQRSSMFDAAFYERKVALREKFIDTFAKKAADPTTAPAHRASLLYNRFRLHLELVILRYTRGESVAAVQAEWPGALAAFTDYRRAPQAEPFDFLLFDNYILGLWLVSLAILVRVNDETWAQLVTQLDNEGRDAVVERLIATRQKGRKQTSTVMYPNPYRELLAAMDNKDAATSHLQAFLKEYYSNMSRAYWHDSDKQNKDPAFFGYWAFELAAIVKALNIDDTSFHDHLYYPKDLV